MVCIGLYLSHILSYINLTTEYWQIIIICGEEVYTQNEYVHLTVNNLSRLLQSNVSYVYMYLYRGEYTYYNNLVDYWIRIFLQWRWMFVAEMWTVTNKSQHNSHAYIYVYMHNRTYLFRRWQPLDRKKITKCPCKVNKKVVMWMKGN